MEVTLSILLDFLNLPWDRLGFFFGAMLAMIAFFATIGARFGPLRSSIHEGIQDMLGITSLRADLNHNSDKLSAYIEQSAFQDEQRDAVIARAAAAVADAAGKAVHEAASAAKEAADSLKETIERRLPENGNGS